MNKQQYQKYLLSDEWSLKRARAIELAGGRCQLCNSEDPLNVHHRTYERIGDERPEDLTVLCKTCHALHHAIWTPKSQKRMKRKLTRHERNRLRHQRRRKTAKS